LNDKTLKIGKGILAKCRKLVHLFAASNQKSQRLDELQVLSAEAEKAIQRDEEYACELPKDVIQDVITRWWSTYDMIERLLYLRPALEFMEREDSLISSSAKKDDPSSLLCEMEWDVLEGLEFILKPLKDAQKMLESQTTVTSSWVLWLVNLITKRLGTLVVEDEIAGLEHLTNVQESLVELVEDMKKDIHERCWGEDIEVAPFHPLVQREFKTRQVSLHPNFGYAPFFDPCFKNLDCIEDDCNKNLLYEAALDKIVIVKKQLMKRQKDPPAPSVPTETVDLTTDGGANAVLSRPTKKRKHDERGQSL
jgi:hypothetical protein